MIETILPAGWKAPKGYANGVLAEGGRLYIGGQIGWNADQVFESRDFAAQMEQALRNIAEIVRAAGGDVGSIVRLTWYVTDKREYLARQREVDVALRPVPALGPRAEEGGDGDRPAPAPVGEERRQAGDFVRRGLRPVRRRSHGTGSISGSRPAGPRPLPVHSGSCPPAQAASPGSRR